ncbi:MAG: sulfite exporter TauE/SafE family protein [Gammaproteobacteria bacterium]|nr:sulfite exporter TauE/SafE family protein [Gammaproteobacteria bacterium]
MYFEIADIVVAPWTLLAWGLLVGLVFSTVGAAGGILASVGMISVFGLQDPNLVKPMAQAMTLVTPLVAVPLYMRQCRVVYRLALLLGAGGVLGALLGSSLSHRLLADMSLFRTVFAVLVFFIAAQLIWQILRTRTSTAELSRAMRAAESFEYQVKGGGDLCDQGVRCIVTSFRRVVFAFGNERFSFNPLLPFFTGLGIAVLSSALGVGGGFLLVPFMSIVMRLPMYVVAGTSALAIAIHSITSIGNYIRLGIELDLAMLGFLLAGVIAGSVLGPLLSKHLPENGLRGLLAVILIIIGLRYAGLL